MHFPSAGAVRVTAFADLRRTAIGMLTGGRATNRTKPIINHADMRGFARSNDKLVQKRAWPSRVKVPMRQSVPPYLIGTYATGYSPPFFVPDRGCPAFLTNTGILCTVVWPCPTERVDLFETDPFRVDF